ncbi:unnamed protein product [Orchesella dallaii]|uniref:PseI/NeuA/B-like domain-containing protein n=1 Tax=Orchesella dallaii TaxID=48710 RepID=A0ABP1S179_9HEXA
MADFDAVNSSRSTYHFKKHNSTFALLNCVSAYRTPPEDVNLSLIQLYKNRFPDIPIGYSGPEEGIVIVITAVAYGAKNFLPSEVSCNGCNTKLEKPIVS